MQISVFEVMSLYPIDQYQNAIPRAIRLHKLKQVQSKEYFMLMTHDSIGHLERSAWVLYCWVVALSLNGDTVAYHSALKKKCLGFQYESSLVLIVINQMIVYMTETAINLFSFHIMIIKSSLTWYPFIHLTDISFLTFA